jgi:translation initiation factor 5B
VKVEEGSLRVNTPICVQNKEAREAGRLEWIDLGRVTSIESNHKPVEIARKGDSVAVRIEGDDNRIYGRHFEHPDRLYSRISRESIDALKKFHREQVTKEDIQLLKMMKKLFSID